MTERSVPRARLARPWRQVLARSDAIRLAPSAHYSRPWRIHDLTPDFRLEDVWALPTPGRREDLPRLVRLLGAAGPKLDSSRSARMLWAIRRRIGARLGWDRPVAGLGSRVRPLRERLPADLRAAPPHERMGRGPFLPLYQLENEWAAELANRTVHGVMHIGWVPDGAGGYRGQMAVLVRPNRALGRAYMAAIRPFRRMIVYPAMMRGIAREWRSGPEHGEHPASEPARG